MKTKKNRNPKGTVLFTVVAVMSLMIIFMTCTLAMAAAANRRSRKTYSSSQSSYTARTVMDSILAAVGTDIDFSKSIRELNVGESIDVLVDFNDPTMGRVESAKVTRSSTKTVYDPDLKDWVVRNLYTITADVIIGGERTTVTNNILQDPPVQKQKVSKGGSSAGFLTYGGASVSNGNSSWGGTYFGMGNWGDKTQNWQGLTTKYNYYGNAQYITVDKHAYRTGENYETANGKQVYETPYIVNGNLKITHDSQFVYTYTASGVDNPGIQVWGDLDIAKDVNTLTFTISDKANAALKAKKAADYSNLLLEMPYLYVDGAIKAANDQDFKLNTGNNGDTSKTIPMNIFAGSLNMDGASNQKFFGGNVYLMDEGVESSIKCKATKLYSWTDSAFNGGELYTKINGSMCSNGSITLLCGDNGAEIKGDLIAANNIKLGKGGSNSCTIKVNGNVVCGGKLTVDGVTLDVTGNIYCESSEGTLPKTKMETSAYKSTHGGTIYPAAATREKLMGITWPVKGVEGKMIEEQSITFGAAEIYDGANYATAQNISGKDHVQLTGDWNVPVTITANAGQTVTVCLKNVNFICPTDGKEIKNTTVINTTGAGKVQFYVDGYAKTNYNWAAENGETKLLKTVWDWMDDFQVEAYKEDERKPYMCGVYIADQNEDAKKSDGSDFWKDDGGAKITLTYADTVEKLVGSKGDFKDPNNKHITSDDYMSYNSGEDLAIMLRGTCIGKNTIDAPAKGKHLWVILDSFQTQAGASIIINDVGEDHAGEVWFYVLNKKAFDTDTPDFNYEFWDNMGHQNAYTNCAVCLRKSPIASQRFLNVIGAGNNAFADSGLKDFYIYCSSSYMDQMGYTEGQNVFDKLQVRMYADDDTMLGMGDGMSYITAYINAIDMDFVVNAMSNGPWLNKCYYDGFAIRGSQSISDGDARCAVVGCLNVKTCNSALPWFTLYVNEGDPGENNNNQNNNNTSIKDAEGLHTYEAVEYMAYTN